MTEFNTQPGRFIADTRIGLGKAALEEISSTSRQTGPRAANFQNIILPDALFSNLPVKHRTPEVFDVIKSVTGTYDRILNKKAILPSPELGRDITDSVVRILGKIYTEDSDIKIGKNNKAGIARIVRDMDVDRALHYLDNEFIGKLQDMGPEDSTMWGAIGDYFTISELLRRASVSPNADKATVESVHKAWEIAIDRKGYIENLGVDEADDLFIESLTDEAILEMTTRLVNRGDERLRDAASRFSEYRDKYPTLVAYGAKVVVSRMLRGDVGEKMEVKMAKYEDVAQLLIREGISPETAVFYSIRYLDGKRNAQEIDRIISARGKRVVFDGYRNGRTPEQQGVVDRGVLSPEDLGMVKHGPEFRKALFEIDATDKLTRKEKHELYRLLKESRNNHAEYTLRVEPVVGKKVSDNERRQYDLAISKILYGVKYWIDYGSTEQIVPMGSKEVAISLKKEDVFEGLGYLHQHSINESRVIVDTDVLEGKVDIDSVPNLEIGLLEEADSRMLLLTKVQRAPVIGNFERGKSPRINRACAVLGGQPSLIAEEREKTCLSLRNDLDSDGTLRLDIGGKTNDLYTPDFLVAKLVSLGGWYYAQLHGKEATDYHVDIDRMSEEEFARIVERYRRAVHYVGQPLRISSAPSRGAQADRDVASVLELHQSEPVQKVVA